MDKIKVIGYVVLVSGVLLLGYFAYEMYFKQSDVALNQKLIPQDQCQIETKTFKAGDAFMAGIIENGQEFKVTLNYYKCNPLRRGDVVLYRYSSARDPVPRIARGIPGDKFKLVKDKTRPAWNVEINGKTFEYKDEPYFFGSENAPTLGLYEKSSQGLIDSDTAIVFSNVPPGGSDSGIFGAVSIQDLIGKVDVASVGAAGTTSEPVVESNPTPEPTPTPSTTSDSQVPSELPAKEAAETAVAPAKVEPKKASTAKKTAPPKKRKDTKKTN